MPEVIVDTSALIAFFVKSERHHEAARQYVLGNLWVQWVILDTVFDETVTWLRAKVSLAASIAYLYGSEVRGQAGPWSDIDVAIISPDFADDLFAAQLALMQLAASYGRSPVTAQEWRFLDSTINLTNTEMTIFTAKEQRGKEAGGSLFSLPLCSFASLQ